jgi:putative DNA primase/helicase
MIGDDEDAGAEFDRLFAETKRIAQEREAKRAAMNEKPPPTDDIMVRLGMREASIIAKEMAPPFSEEDLALHFADRHAGDLRHVAQWNQWLAWNGRRWRSDDRHHALHLARRQCRDAAAASNQTKGLKTIASNKTVMAVVSLARADPRLAATVDEFDADPWLLNTPDCVFDLRTGTKRPHRPDDYMTKITAVGPRPGCPKWTAFLHRIMGGNKELIGYLQRVSGYCLTGSTREQAMFFAYGVGANGKGVFLQTVSGIMGDYAKMAAIETFTESKTDRHPTEIARLHNARLVTATETEPGRHWAESRIKLLTGGDTVTAHFMRKDDFEYVPLFKLFFSGNHKPGLRSTGEAMRRRLNMIHFAVVIPEGERDPQFSDKLKPEWAGILQWMIEGGLEYQKRGLDPPPAVAKATDDYFTAQNSFAYWIEDCCERDPNAWTPTTTLFASFKTWCEKASVRHGNITTFGEALTDNGCEWQHTNKGNGYWGLRIRQDPPPPHWQDDKG